MSKFDDIDYTVTTEMGKYGVTIGYILIVAPLVYDILSMGFRGFWHWDTSPWGKGCQLLGMVIALYGLICEWRTRK